MTRQLDDFSKEKVVLTLEYVLRVLLELAEPPPQGGSEIPHLRPPQGKEGAPLT